MAKIADALDRALSRRALHGTPGRATGRPLARGDGWTVDDVVCTSGPADRPFEERHSRVSIAIVAAGTFQYRSTAGRALMTPGSVLLGNAGSCFECGHEHSTGDRCVAFNYSPELFEQIAADAGVSDGRVAGAGFSAPRLPPMRDSAGVVALACAAVVDEADVSWEEMAIRLGARVARLTARRVTAPRPASAGTLARVTRAVRAIERAPSAGHTLSRLSAVAGLSPYHFLRTFQQVAGVTPHQYVRRSRLREAAMRLTAEQGRIIDVAFESGFGDLSNFNRAFRAEFALSPRAYRSSQGRLLSVKAAPTPR